MLLSLLFADDAFAVPGLKLADLLNLRIPPSKRELLIPIKLSKAELPLFQRTEHTTNSVKMLCKAVTENWLCERLQLLGQITGFDLPVKPYCFRWGHSEALDSSSVYIINSKSTEATELRICHRLHQRLPAQPHSTALLFGRFPAQLPITVHYTGHAGSVSRLRAANCHHTSCERNEPLDRPATTAVSDRSPGGDGRSAPGSRLGSKSARSSGRTRSRSPHYDHPFERDDSA